MRYVVAVYLVELKFGGPEEGGWWYQGGFLVKELRRFEDKESGNRYASRLNDKLRSRKFGPNRGRRKISSVLSEGEFQAHVEEGEARPFFPDAPPRYE